MTSGESKADKTLRLINFAQNFCMQTEHGHDFDDETL